MSETQCPVELRECEVVFKIPNPTEKLDAIYRAIDALREIGITFDTGCGFGFYDWELDWSLKGAKVLFKKFSDGKLPSGKPISS